MSKTFDDIKVNDDIKRFVRKSLEISDYISFLLEKHQLTQKELANKLGKSESEISKWLSGTHNFTMKTISKIESILKEDIITTNSMFSKMYALTSEQSTIESGLSSDVSDFILSISINNNNKEIGSMSSIEEINRNIYA